MWYLLCGTVLVSSVVTGSAVVRRITAAPRQDLDPFGDFVAQGALDADPAALPYEDEETEIVDRDEVLAKAAVRGCTLPGAEVVFDVDEPLASAWFDQPCSSAGWVQEFA